MSRSFSRAVAMGLVGSFIVAGCGGATTGETTPKFWDETDCVAAAADAGPKPLHCALADQRDLAASRASTYETAGVLVGGIGALTAIAGISLLAGGPLHDPNDDDPKQAEISLTTAGALLFLVGGGLWVHGNQKAEQSRALAVRAAREAQDEYDARQADAGTPPATPEPDAGAPQQDDGAGKDGVKPMPSTAPDAGS